MKMGTNLINFEYKILKLGESRLTAAPGNSSCS